MGPNGDKGYRAIPGSRDRGCGAGRAVADRRLTLGRAVPVGDSAGGKEWKATGGAGGMVLPVRRVVSVEVTGRVVVIRAETPVRGLGVGDREPT